MKEHTHCTHCKTNLHLPMIHLHFTRSSPFSRQKPSPNGLDTAWAEGRHYTHPHHHCTTRGACTAHIVHKWSPHSRCNSLAPPTYMQHGQHTPDPSENIIAFGLQSLARLQSSAQPLCLQTEPLLYYSRWREQTGPLPYQLAYHHGACLFPGFLQSMATEGWKVRRRLWLPCCCQR